MENGLFFWIIFLKYDIKKNMKFAHGFDKTKRHDQKTLVFASTFPSLYVFPGMEYQETSVGFIFLNILRQVGEKTFYLK